MTTPAPILPVGDFSPKEVEGGDSKINKEQRDRFWKNLYSQQDGVCLNGRSMASDRLTIQRDDNPVSAWLHWHQGSGIFDWRLGMEPAAGSYDLVLCNPMRGIGQAGANNPGPVVLRIKPDGTLVNKTIAALEQRIANLEAHIRSMEK